MQKHTIATGSENVGILKQLCFVVVVLCVDEHELSYQLCKASMYSVMYVYIKNEIEK